MIALALAASIAWLAPTERENGAEIDDGELSHYEIKADCLSELIGPIEATSYDFGDSLIGCSLSVRVIDTNGLASAWSETKTIEGTLQAPRRGGIR